MTFQEKYKEIITKEQHGVYTISDLSKDDIRFIEGVCVPQIYSRTLIDVKLNKKDCELTIVKRDTKSFFNDMNKRLERFIGDDTQETLSVENLLDKDIMQKDGLYEYKDFILKDITRKCSNFRSYKHMISHENGILNKKLCPYTATFFAKNNQPYVTLKADNLDKFICSNLRDYTWKESEITCKYKNFQDLLDRNKIEHNELIINKDSIETFYMFEADDSEIYFVKPTKKYVELWWNYDIPNLYKFSPNVDTSTNYFGTFLDCFMEELVSASFYNNYVSDSITKEEVEMFAGNYKHTGIYSSMKRIIDSRNVTEEDKKEIAAKVSEIEQKINECVQLNKVKILESVIKNLYGNIFEDNDIKRSEDKEEDFKMLQKILTTLEPEALDCGFLYYEHNDKELEDLFAKAGMYQSNRYGKYIHVDSLWDGQSTTIKKVIGKEVCDTIKESIGLDIYSYTVLD